MKRPSAIQLAAVTALLFAAGVFVQRLGVNRSNDAVEVVGIVLWCSPLGLWTAIAGTGSKPRKRKQLNSTFWTGVVLGVLMILVGISALFSADNVVPGAALIGVSMLPFGLAIGARRTPVLHHETESRHRRGHA